MATNVISAVDGYLIGAISAFNGLQALDEATRLEPVDKARNSSILAALATESALKHYLAKTGVSEKRVRDLRHELSKLWKEAQAAGLAVQSSPPHWCQLLTAFTDSPLYFARYAYGAAGAVVVPPQLLVAEVDRLIRLIYPALPPLRPRLDGMPRITFAP